MSNTAGGRSPVESLRLVRQALGHRGLTDRQRVVLAYLASHDPSQFTPTVGVIAADLWGEDSRRNRDQVRKFIRALEELGVLRTVRRTAGGKLKQPHYVVCLSDGGRPSPLSKKDQDPDGEPPSPLSERAAKGRGVTASGRQGDGERQGLRAIGKNKTEKNKKEKSDGERPSPTRKVLATESPKEKREQDSILGTLRKNPDGLRPLDIALSLGKSGSIEIKEPLQALIGKGLVRQDKTTKCFIIEKGEK